MKTKKLFGRMYFLIKKADELKLFFFVFFMIFAISCKKNIEILETKDKEPNKQYNVEMASPEIIGELVLLGTDNGNDLFATKKEGRYIIDGDIILNEEQVDFFKSKPQKKGGMSTKSTFVLANLWPDGIVYYSINNNVYNSQIILDAINHWEANTTITFVPRTNQPSYVEFVPSSGNSSALGMQNGKQEIELSSNAITGTAIHEIGHALGLMHEQSRADRDSYIVINNSNIQNNKKLNFQKYAERGIQGGELGEFDFGSIMMYPSITGFEINGSIPSITKIGGAYIYAQRSALSIGDLDAISYLYNYSAYKKIYVKQVPINYVDSSWWTSTSDQNLIDYETVLEFYEDASYTIPYMLEKPLNIKHYYTMGSNHYGGWSGYTLVPAGVQSYLLGSYHIDRSYFQGNLVSDYSEGILPVTWYGYHLW